MIKSKNDLKFYLEEDAKCYNILNSFKYWIRLLYGAEDAHALKYLRNLRRYEYYNNNKSDNLIYFLLYLYYRFRWMRLSLKYKVYIGPNMIGYAFHISHLAGGIIINCGEMGNHCRVNGGVIVGNKDDQKAIAKIGDFVKLSAGCKVFGLIDIGDNVTVAPNAVVVKNVPNNCIVAGVPAKIIKINGEKVDIRLI